MEAEIKRSIDQILIRIYLWRYRMVLAFVLSALLAILSQLPYFNLLIQTQFLVFAIIAINFIALKTTSGKIILFGMVPLFISLMMYLTKQYEIGEFIGNYVYGFYFLAAIKALFEK